MLDAVRAMCDKGSSTGQRPTSQSTRALTPTRVKLKGNDMNDFDAWEEEEAARRRAQAEREDADPIRQARLRAKRAEEQARIIRNAAQYEADKAEAIERGEWIEEDEED